RETNASGRSHPSGRLAASGVPQRETAHAFTNSRGAAVPGRMLYEAAEAGGLHDEHMSNPVVETRASAASEPRQPNAPAERRAGEGAGEREGRSPSNGQ